MAGSRDVRGRGKEATEKRLSLDEVRRLIRELKDSAVKKECWSCECFQAFWLNLKLMRRRVRFNRLDSSKPQPMKSIPV